jgi:hypothetical protein
MIWHGNLCGTRKVVNLRVRILHDLPERAVSDDWKIPRCRADSLLTNSHI